MKRIKTIVNAIWFIISVAAVATSTLYAGVFVIGGMVKGFSSYTLDDWFYWFLIGIPVINIWHGLKDCAWWWKPFGKKRGTFSSED